MKIIKGKTSTIEIVEVDDMPDDVAALVSDERMAYCVGGMIYIAPFVDIKLLANAAPICVMMAMMDEGRR